jgi:hypothetical protein
VPAAWESADAEQRNALARLAFQSKVTDGSVTAVTPTPAFAPCLTAGNSDAAPDAGGGVNLQMDWAEATGFGFLLAS